MPIAVALKSDLGLGLRIVRRDDLGAAGLKVGRRNLARVG
jgi:hypothetical protein